MTPRQRAGWQLALLIAVGVGLLILFPRAFAFLELAARQLRYLWWLVLLVALALWLLYAANRRPR